MKFIKSKTSNDKESVNLHYVSYGKGQPILFIHGWPLSHQMWEPQLQFFADMGYQAIAYDRRGFGNSDKPYNHFDYDTLAEDTKNIIDELGLENVTLVGFSMGGGEVVRYLSKFGSSKISRAVLMSSIIPLVAQTDDNPNGVPQKELNGILDNLKNDRITFLEGFGKNFLNAEKLKVSEALLNYHFSIAAHASPRATIETAKAWASTDFRDELSAVDVPVLIIHGDADQIVPRETSADQAAEGISDSRYELILNGPHGLNYTHTDKVNEHLLAFVREEVAVAIG